MVSQKEINQTYREYKNATNMTERELKIWKDNPKSKEASLSREPIKRNVRLLSTPKAKWGAKEVKDANRTISYLARAKGIEKEYRMNNPKDKSLTPNRIALRNWGYDVFKGDNKLRRLQ